MIDPIIIVGCARSGTSMTAGIVNICGAFGGDMFGPCKANKKGMFENKELRQNVVKPYLNSIGVDPLAQKPLPSAHHVFGISANLPKEWRSRVQQIYQYQGYIDGPWFMKSAKAALIWLLWHKAFPEAKWVLVRRKSEDIADSCMRTSFMRAYNTHEGWMKWVKVHEKRFDEIKNMGINLFEFWPSNVLDGDFQHAEDMVNFLGLEYRHKEVETFIDPTMYKRSNNG